MTWILIILAIYLVYRWSKGGSGGKTYQNQALQQATSASVEVVLANGVRNRQLFELDVRSSGKMPGTNLPCYIFMLDIDYLQTWAREQHNSSVSGFDNASLRLNGPSGKQDMSRFNWTIVLDSSRGVGDLFIRQR